MPIFLVTPLQHQIAPVRDAVSKVFAPGTSYELQAEAGWLVHYRGTAVELSNHLQITGPTAAIPLGSVLVTSVGSYFGRGPTEMWEWLKTRTEMGS
jgi:hypothetical protein